MNNQENLLPKLIERIKKMSFGEETTALIYSSMLLRLPRVILFYKPKLTTAIISGTAPLFRDGKLSELSSSKQAKQALFFTFFPGGTAIVDKGNHVSFTGPWLKVMVWILKELEASEIEKEFSMAQIKSLSVFLGEQKDAKAEFA